MTTILIRLLQMPKVKLCVIQRQKLMRKALYCHSLKSLDTDSAVQHLRSAFAMLHLITALVADRTLTTESRSSHRLKCICLSDKHRLQG